MAVARQRDDDGMVTALDPSADAAALTADAGLAAATERVAPTDIARSALSQPQQRDAVDYVLSTQEGRLPASPLRQFRNAKGSIDPLDLAGQMLEDFGQVCAVILARGTRARSTRQRFGVTSRVPRSSTRPSPRTRRTVRTRSSATTPTSSRPRSEARSPTCSGDVAASPCRMAGNSQVSGQLPAYP